MRRRLRLPPRHRTGSWVPVIPVNVGPLLAGGDTVAASMLKAAFHMLRDGTLYCDLGGDHFDKTAKEKVAKRLVRRLADLGYQVELKPAATPSPLMGVSF